MAINSFGCKETERFYFEGRVSKNTGWRQVAKAVQRKLDMIAYADKLEDLKSPPGNRLEKLKGDLLNYFSIRINDQWRIIFKWSVSGAEEVMITDYHK